MTSTLLPNAPFLAPCDGMATVQRLTRSLKYEYERFVEQ